MTKVFLEKTEIQGIANTIREKNGTETQYTPSEMPQGIESVYDAGYEKGKTDNAKEEQEKTISITKNGTTEVLPDETKVLSKVNIDVNVPSRDFERYVTRSLDFAYTIFPNDYEFTLNLEQCAFFTFVSSTGLKRITIKGNIANKSLQFNQTFLRCKELVEIDFLEYNLNVGSLIETFRSASSLKRILGRFDLTTCTKFQSVFTDANALEEIRFVEGSIRVNFDTRDINKLSVESGKSILLGLANFAGTDEEFLHTVTLHSNLWTLLDVDGETAPNGLTWRNYVSSIGWLS